MKTKISAILLVTLLITSLAACGFSSVNSGIPKTEIEKATETETETPDAVETHSLVMYASTPEYTVSSGETVYLNPSSIGLGVSHTTEKQTLEMENRTFEMSGKTVELTYKSSMVYGNKNATKEIASFYGTDSFVDTAGNTYDFYQGSDVLKQFNDYEAIRGAGEDKGKKKTMEELAALADEVVQTYAKQDDLSRFEKGEVSKRGDQYYVTYYHKFCGYKTDFYISMSFTASGRLAYYMHHVPSVVYKWADCIDAETINEAKNRISIGSHMHIDYVSSDISLGDDGYLYLVKCVTTRAYMETDENGNDVGEVPSTTYYCYVRLIPNL